VYAFNVLGFIVLVVFTGTHIKFVIDNTTTIEAMLQKNLDQVIFWGLKILYSIVKGHQRMLKMYLGSTGGFGHFHFTVIMICLEMGFIGSW
jgi:hypothetical protein